MKTNTMGILAIVMMAAMVAPAFADAPTVLNTNWNGAGILDINFTAGNDLNERFTTGGSLISGNFQATDFNNNPYGYSVDSVNSYVTAKVIGGYATYQADRTDFATHPGDGENSTVPYMYGYAGQQLYAAISAINGSAEMAIGTQNNYASLKAGTYSMPKTTNGKNFEANAQNFTIQEQILDGSGDGANFVLVGSGSAMIDSMSSEMGSSSFNFGKGLGCYTNADLDATGTGSFMVNAWADNGLNIDKGTIVIPGSGVNNGATYNLQIGYNGHFVYDNFALGGN